MGDRAALQLPDDAQPLVAGVVLDADQRHHVRRPAGQRRGIPGGHRALDHIGRDPHPVPDGHQLPGRGRSAVRAAGRHPSAVANRHHSLDIWLPRHVATISHHLEYRSSPRSVRSPGEKQARLTGVGHVQVVAGAGAGHEQDAALPLQILGVGDGVLARRGDRGGGRDLPCSTPITATAWNSRPFMPCMVPTRTACLLPLAAERDRRDAVRLERVAGLAGQVGGPGRHPDGMRLDPASSQERIRSARKVSSSSRVRPSAAAGAGRAWGTGSRPGSPPRRPGPATGSGPSSGTAQARISWVVR